MTALDILVRTSIVLLAGLGLRALAGSRSAALRHAILAATIAGAVGVVPLSALGPSWTVTLRSTATAARPQARARVAIPARTAAGESPAAVSAHPVPLASALWAAGFAVSLGLLGIGGLRLKRLARRATPLGDARWRSHADEVAAQYRLRHTVALLEGDAPFFVATWGVRRARVLVPPGAVSWPDGRIRAVLGHELAHVARGDWLVHMGAQVGLAALWFHPLAWIACRQLRRDSEQACDDAVLGHGVPAADYAGHLVALAREYRRAWSWLPALPVAHRSAFERRIAAMLNPRFDRTPLSHRTAAAAAVAVMALTLPAAAVRAVQIPAALSGTVYDVTGAVLPGVTLTIENPQHQKAQAATDAAGRFAFPGVGPGRYVLSVDLAGFRSLRDEFDLASAADWDRAVTLQVGTVQETVSVRASRTPAAPATTPGGPVPVRVGGNIRAPRKEIDVRPIYPASMRAAGREGQVSVEATIGRDGTVSTVRVLSAQVHPDFAIAAADAVRQWRFSPTLLNGKPVEVVMTVTVAFSLSD